MRRIAANYIYPVSQEPLKNGIIEIDNYGEIVNIIDTGGVLTESRNLEFYNGVLVPGFVNAHCHLELSERKGDLDQGLTLPGFIRQMVGYRKNMDYQKAISKAQLYDQLMQANGIVAVGDIVNTPLTIEIKAKSKIYYHSFLEIIGLGKNYEEIFIKNLEVYNQYKNEGLIVSVVPHAPYSVSQKLFKKIIDFSIEASSVLSIHNQESEHENEMYRSGKGKLVEVFKEIGLDLSNWVPTGENSADFLIQLFPKNATILFVHNLYTSKREVDQIAKKFDKAYFVLCPLSNYFIESKYPELDNFIGYNDRIAIGTDSLASNHTLSILEEMKVLIQQKPEIAFKDVLQWGTLNGAKALNIDNRFGSFKKGKKPGINLITDFDFTKMQLQEKSKVKVLV